MDEGGELKQLITRFGDKALAADANAKSALERVQGTSDRMGLSEEVAELKASHRAAERERDQLSLKIDKIGEKLDKLGESLVRRTWPERWATVVGWTAVTIAIGVALVDYFQHARGTVGG